MFFFFFFKQKTAYEMRISDWSSDVCSSDLANPSAGDLLAKPHQKHRAANQRRHARDAEDPARIDYGRHALSRAPAFEADGDTIALDGAQEDEIGRASCRERVCQYV